MIRQIVEPLTKRWNSDREMVTRESRIAARPPSVRRMKKSGHAETTEVHDDQKNHGTTGGRMEQIQREEDAHDMQRGCFEREPTK